MSAEEVNINISLNKNENKVIITTSDRNGDLLHKKEIKLQNENNFPIGLGHSGLYVDNIQRFLTTVNKNNLSQYGIDTIFGEETRKACIKVFGTSDISYTQYSMIENFLVSINKYRKP
jgi:hypothetical protein